MVDALLLKLQQGVETILPTATDLPLSSYLAYMELLAQWNTVYNLTAIDDMEKMLSYHVLDSLSILPFIDADMQAGAKCLDVATGAGLPSVILALARPEATWVALDSNAKKIRFLRYLVLTLPLKNVQAMHCRIENYVPEQLFSVIVSRAFSSLARFFNSAYRLLVAGGSLWAMKGINLEQELAELYQIPALQSAHYSVQTIPLQVPGVTVGRSVVQIKSSQ